MKKLIAGNWKMHSTLTEAKERIAGLTAFLQSNQANHDAFDMLVCPPATMLCPVQKWKDDAILSVGGQDVHINEKGAHTGDISAEMVADTSATYALAGHSERRADHGETSDIVRQKAEAAHRAGLIAVICVGEQESDRDANQEYQVISAQLKQSIPAGATSENTVIAYEPVWAIGTGKVAEISDIEKMHAHIRNEIVGKVAQADQTRLLYGGSVKPTNAADILHTANVDGVLVGGASLLAEDFINIAKAA